ncbi:MAG: hypothetical protein ACREOK_07305 [Gemmatimonadaceae bacterium]
MTTSCASGGATRGASPRTPKRYAMNKQEGIHSRRQGPIDRRASDGSATRATLADALDRCRAELELRVPAVITGQFSIGALASLRDPVAEFAALASREELPPERALVMFKKMIGQIADIERCQVEQRELMHRQLVEMAIESYFGDRGAATPPPAAG